MPRPSYNPFRISEADSSVNFFEEQHLRRQRKRWAVSRAKRTDQSPNDGKFLVRLDSFTSVFLHEYARAMKLCYGDVLSYLLGALATAYNDGRKHKDFSLSVTWEFEREECNDLNQDNDR